jgi:hypothetical protein
MAVFVTGQGADVVGGDHPTPAVVEAVHDEDGTEVRQLVVGQADRPAAEVSNTSSSRSAWMVAARP